MLGAVGAGGAHMMANADTSRVDGKDFYRYHGSVTDRIADKMHPAVDDKGREVYVWIDKIAKPSGVNRYYIPADKVNMKTNEGDKTGPKFTGYWKGTDKGPPGKRMVGSN
jgi:hypothetical protein